MINFEAKSIETSVTVDLGFGSDGFLIIPNVSIVSNAQVLGISNDSFQHCAERARTHCTIARLLRIDAYMLAALTT
jgi:osmotically inducible protein OsmC